MADPQQRSKYDAERQKNAPPTHFSTHWRPASTPKQTPTSPHFPPPPKRPGAEKPRHPTSGTQKPHAPAGNQRYASYTKSSAAEWNKAKDEAEARANSFRAWQNMGSKQAPPPPPPPPPPPRKFNPTAPRPAPPPHPPQPEPSAYPNGGNAGFPGLNRSQSTRKRPGYAPATPGVYNEPMAPPNTSAYQHVSRGDRPHTSKPHSYFDFAPQSPTIPHARSGNSPLRHAKSEEQQIRPQRPGGMERKTTRYATAGGEKTYVGSGVSRSSSLRNSPVDPRYGDHGFERSQLRHGTTRNHSAGPHFRKASAGSDSSDTSSSSDELESQPRPKAMPRRRFERTRARPGQRPGGAMPPTNVQSPQRGQTAHYEYPPPPPRPTPIVIHGDSTNRMGTGLQSASELPKDNRYGPFLSTARKWSQDWGFSPKGSLKSPELKDPLWALPAPVSPEALVKKPSVLHDPPRLQKSPTSFLSSFPNLGLRPPITTWKANEPFRSSPTLDPQADGPHGSPKAFAHDQLNKFSPSDWTDKFSNGDFAPPPNREKSPSKASTTRGRAFSRGRAASPIKDQEHVSEPPPSKGDPTPAFAQAQFSAEEWAKKAKDQTWFTPHSELSQHKSPRPRSKSITTKHSNGPTKGPQNVGNGATGGTAVNSHARESRESLDAMDIDDRPSAYRNERQTNGGIGGRPPSHQAHPRSNSGSQSTAGGVNLNDLSNIAPFTPTGSGLNGMDDLGGDLPFESRPATSVSLDENTASSIEKLDLPRPPKAPAAPLDNDRLTRPVWERYCAAMNAYMKEWCAYNNKILAHFNARQEIVSSSMADNWFSGAGDIDSNGKASVKTYCGWMGQDEKIRESWNVANERHREAMNDGAKAREIARQKAASGKL